MSNPYQLKELFISLLFFFACNANAQDYVISLKHYDVKDGLSHRQVNCIYQDSRGFIWLATKYGLNRFDGYNFRWYTEEKDGLPFNDIQKIAEDGNKNLWLLSSKETIALFNPLKNEVIRAEKIRGYDSSYRYYYLESLGDGGIFFGDNSSGDFFTYYPSGGISKKRIPFSLPYYYIIMGTEKNSFLLLRNNEVDKFDTSEKIVSRVAFLPGSALAYSDRHYIFFQDNKTPNVYSVTSKMQLLKTSILPGKNPSSLDCIFNTGVDGILWRQGKLYHPKKGLLRDFTKEGFSDLAANLRYIFHDNKGRIWLGNDFGLYMLTITRNKFKHYFYNPVFTFDNQNSYRNILVNDSEIYACNESKGIMKASLNNPEKESFFLKGSSYDAVNFYALINSVDGEMLSWGGQSLFIQSLSSPENISRIKVTGFECLSIHQVNDSIFLLGLFDGLVWFNLKQKKFYPFTQLNQFNELTTAQVEQIIAGKNGVLWICTDKGLFTYDSTKGITARYSSDGKGAAYLPSLRFHQIYEDKQDVFWLASADGLIKWDKNKNTYHLFTRADGLSNNNICALYEDDDNRLWLSSDYGIMQFDKTTNKVETYLTEDGITHTEFNRFSHFKDKAGNIYFGSLNGITAFNPKDFNHDENKRTSSPLVVTSFQQFSGEENKLIDKTNELINAHTITLYPEDRFVNLEFALLNFNASEQTTYFWKIDGIDKYWNVQKDRTLHLSNLPYGKKTLHIKAQAVDGTWSNNELQIQLKIIRPIFLRWWFIATVVMLLGLLVFALYRWRIYQFKRENARLEKTIRERTHDLQKSLQQKDVLMKEIHHRVKNNLQIISTLLDLQLSHITDEAANKAIKEGEARVKSIALIHQQLYQTENIAAIELSGFIKGLFQQVSAIYKIDSRQVTLCNNLQETWLDIDTAIPLGLIINELMTNSYKYAFRNEKNPFIELDLEKEGEEYVLHYSDSGAGLPQNYNYKKAKSLGMVLINGLCKQLGGKFLYSNEDKPVFIIHFKDEAGRKMVD
jgi:two-component sensor histidine kinase